MRRFDLDRRRMLMAGAAAAVTAALPRVAFADAVFAPKPGAWRTFEVVTRLELPQGGGAAQAWVPLPAFSQPDWFRPGGSTWTTNAAAAEIARDPVYGAEMLHLSWNGGEAAPVAEVTSRLSTLDRAVDLDRPGEAAPLSAEDRALFLKPTELIPTDGIVKETAERITAGAGSELDKARAIYEWVVANTVRTAATRGCGVGDVAAMLESGNLSGKCADLNALFVGLARAAGLPARDIYGLRVAPSRFGYASLGAKNETVTKAQHCRAEVHLDGFGWVPVDAADVRKVILEEPPGGLANDDPKVVAARAALFGAWEGNWLAYNDAHDVALPGSAGPKIGFLMYPQAETAALGRLDCLDADTFRYAITAREVTA
jgi:transglutaminase-like putative cysteine protease